MGTTSRQTIGRRQIVKAVSAGAAVALAATAASATPAFISAAPGQGDDDNNDNRRGGGNVFLLALSFTTWTPSAFPTLPGPPPKNTIVATIQISINAGNGQMSTGPGNPVLVDLTKPARQIYDQVIEQVTQQFAQQSPPYTVQRNDAFRIVGGFIA